jgi:predicted site-specific integrase-resolvase
MKRQEVANFFRVSLVTIDKWRRYGLLPKTIKQSGRTYFLRKDVEKLVEDKVSMANLKKS